MKKIELKSTYWAVQRTVHSCCDKTRLAYFQSCFPPKKFQTCFFQQTMPDPTVGPARCNINLRNQVAKSENQKSMRYHRDTISTLSSTQWHNSQHRRDPHLEEDRKGYSFDLKCDQFTEIMGHQWAGPERGIYNMSLSPNLSVENEKLVLSIFSFYLPRYVLRTYSPNCFFLLSRSDRFGRAISGQPW